MAKTRAERILELERLLRDAEKLVAFYQGEGEAEIPEENEYRRIVRKLPKNRTAKENRRLSELVRIVERDCLPENLRKQRTELQLEVARLTLVERRVRKLIEENQILKHKLAKQRVGA